MTLARSRKASLWLAVGWFIGAALLLLAQGAAQVAPAAASGVTYYVVVHRSWSLSVPAAFALFGALYLGMTPGFPIRLRPALGWAQLVTTSAGAGLMTAPMLGAAQIPAHPDDMVATFQFWSRLASVGYALMAVGLLIFGWALVEGLRRRKQIGH